MTKFRPCIDLHAGSVKQIVGGTLTTTTSDLRTNHISQHPASYFAELYRKHGVQGGHVIMLGPGNEAAAREALRAWPSGLQVGGGLGEESVGGWVRVGAEKVIVTSYLFPNGSFSQQRLEGILKALDNDKEKLVIDLSCRRRGATWFVAMDKWQTVTDFEITRANIHHLSRYCSEFLIHAADNEGLQRGIDEELIVALAEYCEIPVTYAGGGKGLEDLERVKELSHGKVDLTIGSALDIFGGSLVRFEDCVEWNAQQRR